VYVVEKMPKLSRVISFIGLIEPTGVVGMVCLIVNLSTHKKISDK
jgi:hypothetical protein